ncbi:condensation domain-containing protein, partial [Oleiagrimonas sp. MCCC 1A03011]|uniref:condensation domain-containing protein n=1 Tax=Oleiagrimonas sp. MCCC 1A03011 TaxID=1926883 RepID=UPI001F0C6807
MDIKGIDLKNLDVVEIEQLRSLWKAKGIEKQKDSISSIQKITREHWLPVSYGQQRLWFLTQLDGDASLAYHIPFALHLHGPLSTSVLRRSLNAVWARHEALRTILSSSEGQPYAELLPSEMGMPLIEHDLRHVANAGQHLDHVCKEAAHKCFDLSRGPLIRGHLIHLSDCEYIFILIQHHIISDGWSIGVIIRDLDILYRAFRQGEADPLPTLEIQYPDYAAWQRQWFTSDRFSIQADYWRRILTDAPILSTLPTDRPRPPQQSFDGARVSVQLDASLTQGLKHLSQKHGTTLFMTLMAAWAAVLMRLSGQHDLVIGTPTANRNRTEVEPLAGFFVNVLALRIDLSGDPTLAELLVRVRQAILAAQDHQDLPFEKVVEIAQPPRSLSYTPLFQVMFAWQNNEHGTFDLADLRAEPFDIAFDHVKFDLELHLHENDGIVAGVLNYATALFDAATIERHKGYLLAMLRAMVADAAQSVSRIDLIAPAERTLLLETWNQTEAPYPHDLCIH